MCASPLYLPLHNHQNNYLASINNPPILPCARSGVGTHPGLHPPPFHHQHTAPPLPCNTPPLPSTTNTPTHTRVSTPTRSRTHTSRALTGLLSPKEPPQPQAQNIGGPLSPLPSAPQPPSPPFSGGAERHPPQGPSGPGRRPRRRATHLGLKTAHPPLSREAPKAPQ